MSIGGFNVGFSWMACSSGNLPLPKVSPFLVSSSIGVASFYTVEIDDNVITNHGHSAYKLVTQRNGEVRIKRNTFDHKRTN